MNFSENSSAKSKNKQTSLEEMYTTYELTLFKRRITELTNKQDYKTLLPNASKFDTRTVNKDVPQKTKPFTKSNGKLCNVSRTVLRKNADLKQNNTYIFKSRY